MGEVLAAKRLAKKQVQELETKKLIEESKDKKMEQEARATEMEAAAETYAARKEEVQAKRSAVDSKDALEKMKSKFLAAEKMAQEETQALRKKLDETEKHASSEVNEADAKMKSSQAKFDHMSKEVAD